ncbi:uncharacterized protein CYBJADRAFT_165182 [Cyberlindnera jadinii NRRL Y-1542]|uniref:Uncharacterized protein n=1 Tax=Cyberlindnera jadinii (strain ATCC 18201 / CBS 1600 / BCRC 20928 / JCM 3617 / NBRC 0987 / NRRL Y-1542) TaxID=983966 RepID=A0A1E4S8E5_CYBJN|nr:hypothetical protein CYBJADRAFT_165182 [Cyberlindnera jadinii NRRL Y-1542]ODV75769.1 hypothetical protein CYBJADRAFT_165182 [Cyberlindnera jadinii NRRL Y-1542]
MIPTLNTSLRMTPTVLMRMMTQFMNNNNSGDHRDHGTQFIIQVTLNNVVIIVKLFLSILIYHLFAVIGTKTFTVLEGYLIGSNHIQIFSNNQYNSFAIILGF